MTDDYMIQLPGCELEYYAKGWIDGDPIYSGSTEEPLPPPSCPDCGSDSSTGFVHVSGWRCNDCDAYFDRDTPPRGYCL